uniref:Uncharacterized protein n=1 Tax=Anguilla anguilla TaxID=7936 RepID=A0A0E9TG23_ANGAN
MACTQMGRDECRPDLCCKLCFECRSAGNPRQWANLCACTETALQ